MYTTMTRKKTKKEFKYISKESLELFTKLLEAETIGKKEHLTVPLLLDELKKRNFTVNTDEINNIYAIRGVSNEYPMLNAHMDIYNNNWSWSNFNSYYSITKEDKQLYPNDYEVYESIYDEITFAKEEANWNGKCAITASLSAIDSHLKKLKPKDYENMGYDCFDCSCECIGNGLCENFKYRKLEKCEDILSLESFIDNLEDYSYEATETLDELVDSNGIENNDYKVVVDLDNDKIYGEGKNRVLGGDDKNGIFIALMVAELLPDMPMKIVFTVQEETGCIGIKHFIKNNSDFFDDVKYSLTIDRRGGRDLLWSQCGTRSCNKEFAAKVARQGAESGIDICVTDGNIADVIYIRDLVPNSINMSAGYYNPHTSSEYIIPSEVDKIIGWVKGILTNI